MVQAFAPNGTNDSFNISPLPWRAGRPKNFFDVHDFDLLAEFESVNTIPIAQQIFRRGIERKSLHDLLSGPFGRRMSRDVEMLNASTVMTEDDKYKQNLEPNGGHREQVDGSQLRSMVVEKRPPSLRCRFRIPDHVFGDGGL